MAWKFCENAKFGQSFAQIARNSAVTGRFHKISTLGILGWNWYFALWQNECYAHVLNVSLALKLFFFSTSEALWWESSLRMEKNGKVVLKVIQTVEYWKLFYYFKIMLKREMIPGNDSQHGVSIILNKHKDVVAALWNESFVGGSVDHYLCSI